MHQFLGYCQNYEIVRFVFYSVLVRYVLIDRADIRWAQGEGVCPLSRMFGALLIGGLDKINVRRVVIAALKPPSLKVVLRLRMTYLGNFLL